MKGSILLVLVGIFTIASGVSVPASSAFGKIEGKQNSKHLAGTDNTKFKSQRPRGQVKLGFNPEVAVDASINVSPSGALGWSMGLRTPIGPGESGPDVKILYTGQKHSILGYGMAATGLGSAIRRCNSSHQIDGFTQRFKWDIGDALCLDGQRLISESGEYGSFGATYGVMGKPNVRVEARFESSDLPGSAFSVFYPSGRIDHYGMREEQVSSDAIVYGVFQDSDKVPYAWHISRSIDPSNNLTDYSYDYDDLSGLNFWPNSMVLDKPSHRLVVIKYGGLKVVEAANLPHSRRVDLIYETVNEIVGEEERVESPWADIAVPSKKEWVIGDGFVGGVRYRNRHVLSAIESYAAGLPAWGYGFSYEKAPVSKLYRDSGHPGTYEGNTPTTLRLYAINQRRTGSDEGVSHRLSWSRMRSNGDDFVDRTALSGTGLDGKSFYDSPGKRWQDCDESEHGVIGCIERPIHQVWGDFDGDGNVEALVAAYHVDSKVDNLQAPSGEVANTLSPAEVAEYNSVHAFGARQWEMWNLADGEPNVVQTNIQIPNWSWRSTAGMSDEHVSIQARPPRSNPRLGVMRDEKAHPASWSINYDGNSRTDVLVGVPAGPTGMGGLFMDPPYGLGSETLSSTGLSVAPPAYCEDWSSANEDDRRVCRDKVYRNLRSPVDIDGHPGHLADLKTLILASESTPEHPVWIEQSLNYPGVVNPMLWVQPLDLNGDGLTDLAFCKANESFQLVGNESILPMFYKSDSDARFWTKGSLHYVLNGAAGLDLSDGGVPFDLTIDHGCDYKNAYTIMDLFGDGRESLLMVNTESEYEQIGQRRVTNGEQGVMPSRTESLRDHKLPIALTPTYNYVAFNLERDINGVSESIVRRYTNLPLDLFARQAYGATRISTWQAVRPNDLYTVWDTGTEFAPNRVSWDIQENYPAALRFLQGGTLKHMDLGYGPSRGRTGDFNGDGLSDFVVIEHPGNGCKRVKLPYLQDNTVYDRECTLKDATGYSGPSVEDDYINYNPSPVVTVYFNRGNASFERRVVSTPWGTTADEYSGTIRHPHFSWNSANVIDIDQNGVSDIVWLDRVATEVPDGDEICASVCPDGYPASEFSVNVNLLPFYRGVDVAGDQSLFAEVKQRTILKLHPFVENYHNYTNDQIKVGHIRTVNMHQTEMSMKGHGAQIRLFDLDQSGSLDFLVYHNLTSQWVYINGNPIDHGQNQMAVEDETGSPALNKLVSSRNAMGALTKVTYERLDNRLIEPYTMQDSWQGYPIAYGPRSMSVVGAVHKDNGMGTYQDPDFISRHFYYGKPLFDSLRGLSLGPDRRLSLMHEDLLDGSVTESSTEFFNNAPNFSQEFRLYPKAGSLERVVSRKYGSQQGGVMRYSHSASSSMKFGHGVVPGIMWRQSGRTLKSTWEVDGEVEEHNLLFNCLNSVQDPFVGCDLDETNANFQPMTLEKSNTTFDEFGYPLVSDFSNGVGVDERRVVTTIDYGHRTFDGGTPYRLGLVDRESVANYTPGQGGWPVIRQRDFDHDVLGRVIWTLHDGHVLPEEQVAVEGQYTYDARGNVLVKTIHGADGVTSYEKTVFESTGVFPMHRINALGMQENFEFWPQCGILRSKTSLAKHTEVSDVFESCDVHAKQTFFHDQPISARMERSIKSSTFGNDFVFHYKNGNKISQSEVNRVGQTIESAIVENGERIKYHSFYDRFGRLFGSATPVKNDEPVTNYISYHYDQFGREVERIKPDGTSLKRKYDRHVVTTIDELGHERIAEYDSLGRPIRIEAPQDDLLSAAVCYDYGMLGLANYIGPCDHNSARSTTEMSYDFRGRLNWINDGQAGKRRFVYDSFNRLIQETDANGRMIRHNYDVLGRPSTLIEDFGTAVAKKHEWHWDQPFNGALQYASSPENKEWGVYDEFNRLVGRRVRLDDFDLVTRSVLDEQGRVESTHFPSPVSVGCQDCFDEAVIVDYEYDELDRVVGVYHQNQMLWEVGERDIWGNLVEQRFGNGLIARTQFDDVLGRLLSSSVNKEKLLDDNIIIETPIQELSYQWYDNGWLKKRTRHNIGVADAHNQELFDYYANGMLKGWDVTTDSGIISQYKSYNMEYDSVGNIMSSPMGEYTYQNERLSSVNGPDNSIGYTYDSNGNTIQRVRNGLISDFVYNVRGGLVEIKGTQGSQRIERNAMGTKVAVHWGGAVNDADVIFENGFDFEKNIDRSTYYADGFEMERGGGMGDKVVARYNLGIAHIVREWHDGLSEPMKETFQYITPPDHLKSNTLVTDVNGEVVDERSYDVWGRERNPDAWNKPLDAPINDLTGYNSGYTGHERRSYGNDLIDMNARFYDPYSYRMIQADTIVPDPMRMEDWNRYVYVRNAPTHYNDPTGHSPMNSTNHVPNDENSSAGYQASREFGMEHVVAATGGKTSLMAQANAQAHGISIDRAGPDSYVMSDASGMSMELSLNQLLDQANMKLKKATNGNAHLVKKNGKVVLQLRENNRTLANGAREINVGWRTVRTVASIPSGGSSRINDTWDYIGVGLAARNLFFDVVVDRLAKGHPWTRAASLVMNGLVFSGNFAAEIGGFDEQSAFDFAAVGYSGYVLAFGATVSFPITIGIAAGGVADALCDNCVSDEVYETPSRAAYHFKRKMLYEDGVIIRNAIDRSSMVGEKANRWVNN